MNLAKSTDEALSSRSSCDSSRSTTACSTTSVQTVSSPSSSSCPSSQTLAEGRQISTSTNNGVADGFVQKQEPAPTAEDEDGLGGYIVSATTSVTSSLVVDSHRIDVLPSGSVIVVLELVDLAEVQTLRGRLEGPPGWISILDRISGHRSAVRRISDCERITLSACHSARQRRIANRLRAKRHLEDALEEGSRAAVLQTALDAAKKAGCNAHILSSAAARLPVVLELEAATKSGSLERLRRAMEAVNRVNAQAHARNAKKQLEALEAASEGGEAVFQVDTAMEGAALPILQGQSIQATHSPTDWGTVTPPEAATPRLRSEFMNATSQQESSRVNECMADEGDALDEHQLGLKAAVVNAPDVEVLKAALAEARTAGIPEGLLAAFEVQVVTGETALRTLNQAVDAGDWTAVRAALVVGRQARLSKQQVALAEAALAQGERQRALSADLKRVCRELQASPTPNGEGNVTSPDNRPVATAAEELRQLLAAGHDLGLDPGQLAIYEDALEREAQKQRARQELWSVLTEVQILDPHTAELALLVEAKLQLQAVVSSALLGGLSEAEVAAAELLRRRIHNAVEDRKGAVRVFCRVRPLSSAEVAAGKREIVRIKDCCAVEFESIQPGAVEGKGFEVFGFDACWSPGTQEDVFDGVLDLVQSVVDGYNATLFAYGQTGAGKTYTLYGPGQVSSSSGGRTWTPAQYQRRSQSVSISARISSCAAEMADAQRLPASTWIRSALADPTAGEKRSVAQHRGMCPRAAEELFRILERDNPRYSYSVSLSMVELYCQRFIDLLELSLDKPLRIRTSQDGEVYLENVSEKEVCSAEHAKQLMTAGLKERSIRDTRMNLESSRSHVLFIMKVKRMNRERGCMTQGKMLLVDLAGSERVKRSDVSGVGLKEAIEVNRSLTALADVVAALAHGDKYVPYRNHELTQFMQDSLGGSAKALMFTNLSPSGCHREETLTSLKFAHRVKGALRTPANTVRPSVDSVVARLSSPRTPTTGSHRCPAGTTTGLRSNPRSANRTPVSTPGVTPAQTPVPPYAPFRSPFLP